MAATAACPALSLRCAAAVAVLVLPAGASPGELLATRALPGFSVDLPAGEIVEEGHGYPSGRLRLNIPASRSVVIVTWQIGAIDRKYLELTARTLASFFGVSGAGEILAMPGPGGATVETIAMDSTEMGIRGSVVPCGRRFIYLATVAPPGHDGLHRRVLPTISCRPDPKLEASAVNEIPIHLPLPGWSAVDRSGGQLLLTDGRSLLLLRSGNMSYTTFTATIRAVFGTLGAKVTVTPEGPDAAAITGVLGGEHVDGRARGLRCPDGGGVLLIHLSPDATTAARLHKIVEAARCTEPGEASSTWPDAPAPGRR